MRRAVLLLAVLLLAACGGGGGDGGGGNTSVIQPTGPRLTKSQYEAKLRTIGKQVSEQLGGTLSTTEKNSKEAIDKGVQALRRFADELAKINPPAAIDQLHRDLVNGIRDFADELPDLIDRVSKAKEASDALSIFFGSKSFQELAKVQEELKKRGYTVNLNG
jgi:hypothetical protein